MSKPELTRPEEPDKPRGSWLGIILALVFCAMIFVGLTFLTAGLFGGPFLIVIGGLFAIVALHYVTWGWWLGRVLRQASDEDDEIAN